MDMRIPQRGHWHPTGREWDYQRPLGEFYHIASTTRASYTFDPVADDFVKRELRTELPKAVNWADVPVGKMCQRTLRGQPHPSGPMLHFGSGVRWLGSPPYPHVTGDAACQPLRVAELDAGVVGTLPLAQIREEWLGRGVAELCARGAVTADIVAAAAEADAADIGRVCARPNHVAAVLDTARRRASDHAIDPAPGLCYAMLRLTAEVLAAVVDAGMTPPFGVAVTAGTSTGTRAVEFEFRYADAQWGVLHPRSTRTAEFAISRPTRTGTAVYLTPADGLGALPVLPGTVALDALLPEGQVFVKQ
jgi:hypothetical protein